MEVEIKILNNLTILIYGLSQGILSSNKNRVYSRINPIFVLVDETETIGEC